MKLKLEKIKGKSREMRGLLLPFLFSVLHFICVLCGFFINIIFWFVCNKKNIYLWDNNRCCKFLQYFSLALGENLHLNAWSLKLRSLFLVMYLAVLVSSCPTDDNALASILKLKNIMQLLIPRLVITEDTLALV